MNYEALNGHVLLAIDRFGLVGYSAVGSLGFGKLISRTPKSKLGIRRKRSANWGATRNDSTRRGHNIGTDEFRCKDGAWKCKNFAGPI